MIDITIRLGRRANPLIRWDGVSLNTWKLDADVAPELLLAESRRPGLPVAAPCAALRLSSDA